MGRHLQGSAQTVQSMLGCHRLLFCAMPRVVVDVNEEAYLWLQSQQGQWKPRSAVLREIIDEAMKRQQRQSLAAE